MAVTPATAGPYLPHIRAASPSRGPLASYFPFLSLWLRGGVEETEVKELPTVVWGLRNTSLLILSNKKKKSHSPLDGFWLFLAPISREGREGTGGRLSPVFVFLLVLSLSVGLGEDRVGLTWDRTSKLLWSRSLYADCLACVCRMGELSSSVWAGDLLFPA